MPSSPPRNNGSSDRAPPDLVGPAGRRQARRIAAQVAAAIPWASAASPGPPALAATWTAIVRSVPQAIHAAVVAASKPLGARPARLSRSSRASMIARSPSIVSRQKRLDLGLVGGDLGEGPQQRRVLAVLGDEALERQLEAVERALVVLDPRGRDVEERRRRRFGEPDEQRRLVAEVAVERRSADPRLGGDPADRQGRERLAGGEQLLDRPRAPGARPRRGARGRRRRCGSGSRTAPAQPSARALVAVPLDPAEPRRARRRRGPGPSRAGSG